MTDPELDALLSNLKTCSEYLHLPPSVQSDSDRETISRAKLRLSAIAEMDAGWMDGEGERITSSAIEQAKVIIEFGRTWFNTAGIFPTLDGGIQIENSIDGDEYTFVISPSGEASGLICLSTDETKEVNTILAMIEQPEIGSGGKP